MKHYAIYNSFGINLSADSIGWKIYEFNSKKERDKWVDENEYNGNNYVASKATIDHIRKTFGRDNYQHVGYDTKVKFFGKHQVTRPGEYTY